MIYILTILLFTLISPTSSYAGWTKVAEAKNGDKYYVDFDMIKKQDEYIFWWQLTDRLEPSPTGVSSGKFHFKSDCKMMRYKILSFSTHIEPMGVGPGKIDNNPDKEWGYLPPNSPMKNSLKAACKYAN
jgi:hypothetical protein